MKVRSVTLAFVSSVFLAALGANSGSVFATSNSVNPLTTQAYTALAAGDGDTAISLYSQAIESRELAPELLANALLNRALAYQQAKKHNQAIDGYTAALSLDAMSAELRATALYNRGLSQQKLGQKTLAIEDFTNALLLNPSFSHAFLSRGNTLRDSGQYLFALTDFERALKYNHPDPARVYFSEAQTYDLLHRPADRKHMLEAAVAANPNYAEAVAQLASLPAAASDDKTADAGTDDILTGSISAVGGNTLVHKPDLPKGVEPPAELMAATATPADGAVILAETPVFKKSSKLYQDRVPVVEASAEKTTDIAVIKPVADEKIIAIETVPEIPPAAKKLNVETAKPVVVAKVVKADPDQVASTSPAPAIGWSVQIASADTENSAWTTWKNMQKRFKVLADQAPVVVKADLGAKGIFYRVRLAGFDGQSSAQTACAKLKTKGVSCFVSKAAS
jgi:tetratricopeptide (TPR) repeat protein